MYFLISILAVFTFFTSSTFSQPSEEQTDTGDKDKMIIYESQDYKYRFFKGDTLYYNVAAFDSIVINYGKALEKTRFEYYEITCDSVTKERKFLIGIKLKKLISDESFGKGEIVRRTTSPWIERKTYLWIDSLGNRYQAFPDDSLRYALSPAGAFAPYLFFPFKETYRYINESWLVSSKDTLYENGVPASVLNQSSLFRAKNPVDTLGHQCVRLSYIKTGIGAINILTPEQKLRTEATINGSGIMTISKKECFPVHFFSNIEQKLMIFQADNDEVPGQHYTSVDWTLDKFIPSPERLGLPPKEVPKKKKK